MKVINSEETEQAMEMRSSFEIEIRDFIKWDFTNAAALDERECINQIYRFMQCAKQELSNQCQKLYPPLYRYIRFDENNYWEDYFKGGIFLNQPKNWNDVFDSLLVCESDNYNPERRKRVEWIRTAFQRNRRATCFSEIYDNTPMWAHYAGDSTGMCIAYEFPNNINGALHPVVYADDIKFSVEMIETLIKDDGKEGEIHCPPFPMFVKSKQWEYEREWRFLGGNDAGGFEGMKSCIKAVYFGLKTCKTDIMRALDLICDNFTEIPKLYKMTIDDKTNVLTAENLFKTSYDEESVLRAFNVIKSATR